jgi:hypothetical protein
MKKFVWQIGLDNLRAAYEEALAARRATWEVPLAKRVKELGRALTKEEAYAFAIEFNVS